MFSNVQFILVLQSYSLLNLMIGFYIHFKDFINALCYFFDNLRVIICFYL